jgi:hypothetical protein
MEKHGLKANFSGRELSVLPSAFSDELQEMRGKDYASDIFYGIFFYIRRYVQGFSRRS